MTSISDRKQKEGDGKGRKNTKLGMIRKEKTKERGRGREDKIHKESTHIGRIRNDKNIEQYPFKKSGQNRSWKYEKYIFYYINLQNVH